MRGIHESVDIASKNENLEDLFGSLHTRITVDFTCV